MKRLLPWLLAGLITLAAIIQVAFVLQNAATLEIYIEQFAFVLVVALTAFIGALIIVRQSGNRIGWLMMQVAGVTALPIFYDSAVLKVFLPDSPSILTPGIWFTLWLNGWFWLLRMIAILQIVLRFPSGELLSHRWNWINWITLGNVIVAAFVVMFRDQIGPLNGAWHVDNPVGFLSRAEFNGISLIWFIGLLTLAIGSLTSIVNRFRRGSYVTRQQIKWILYAGALMISIAVFGPVYFSIYETSPVWLNIVIQIAFLTLPLAIANAILRYRLYDIDIIIRRTLSYSILTTILALVYFGGIGLLQNVFAGLFGNDELPLITVFSTLAIAALFNPLRNRIQEIIDRRFFRRKFDAEKALNEFSKIVRDEVDMARLSGSLLAFVESTILPEHTSLWLRDSGRGK